MKKLFLILLLGLIWTSICSFGQKSTVILNDPRTIYIVSTGNIDKSLLELIESNIEKTYHQECVLSENFTLTNDMLAIDKRKYDADKIMSNFTPFKHFFIVTNAQLIQLQDEIYEYNVWGLGYCPGTTSIISTYEMNKNCDSIQYKERIVKLALHEIGHNIGFHHCSNPKCVMSSVERGINGLDNCEKYLCDKCKSLLN